MKSIAFDNHPLSLSATATCRCLGISASQRLAVGSPSVDRGQRPLGSSGEQVSRRGGSPLEQQEDLDLLLLLEIQPHLLSLRQLGPP